MFALRRPRQSKLIRMAVCALPFIVVPLIWELGSNVWGSSVLPSFVETLHLFVNSTFHDAIISSQGGGRGGYLPHVAATFVHVLTGVSLGTLTGVFAALALHYAPRIREYFEPLLEAVRVVPPLILVPFVLLVVGPTELAQFIVCGLYVALTVFIYAVNALENVTSEYWVIARINRASQWQTLSTVAMPAILPELIGGVRISIATALGIVVVGEYLGAPSGIGRVLKFALSFARIDLILVGVVWTAILGLVLDTLVNTLLRRTTKWKS